MTPATPAARRAARRCADEPYAVVGRPHNEGHGKRLTAAFEALEALPGARRVAQPPAAR